MITTLDPWPLAAAELEVLVDGEWALDDVEVAARADWLVGDLAGLTAARHRLAVYAGHRPINRVITVGFDEAAPMDHGRALPWREWADQYEAWWRGWSEYWAQPAEPRQQESATESGHAIAEPVVDLDPHAAPAELMRPVLRWFEEQQAAIATQLFARSIQGWWTTTRRATVSVLGVEHYPPSEGDPADSVVVAWRFELRWRDPEWVLRSWEQRGVDELPAWASRWTSGALRMR